MQQYGPTSIDTKQTINGVAFGVRMLGRASALQRLSPIAWLHLLFKAVNAGLLTRPALRQRDHLGFPVPARYCPLPAASILAALLMKDATSRCSFSRDFFSMYIMWPAS